MSKPDSKQSTAANNAAGQLLLLLCNEPMRRRCRALAAAVQSKRLSVRHKCVTYLERPTGFSVSESTDRLIARCDLLLCLLRVTAVSADALGKLVTLLTACGCPRIRPDRVLLVQCCGHAYTVERAADIDRESTSRPVAAVADVNPYLVDLRLRAWLAECTGCCAGDFASLAMENASLGKALRHRLFGRRYTMQVESSVRETSRRASLYRLTSGCEAENGGCSPAAVVKRCLSLDEHLDSAPDDRSVTQPAPADLNGAHQDDEELFQLNPGCTAVTLVVCASASCSKEAVMCLNNLSSRGHRALSLDAFAADPRNHAASGGAGLPGAPAQLRALTRLSSGALSACVLVMFCRRPASRLLAGFLRAASAGPPPAPSPPLPRACFAVLVDSVTESECEQLRQIGCGLSPRCQLDVVCCPQGLRGGRMLDCLAPGLAALMRQLEAQQQQRGRRPQLHQSRRLSEPKSVW